jgi:hypothetical protein
MELCISHASMSGCLIVCVCVFTPCIVHCVRPGLVALIGRVGNPRDPRHVENSRALRLLLLAEVGQGACACCRAIAARPSCVSESVSLCVCVCVSQMVSRTAKQLLRLQLRDFSRRNQQSASPTLFAHLACGTAHPPTSPTHPPPALLLCMYVCVRCLFLQPCCPLFTCPLLTCPHVPVRVHQST